MKRYQAKTKTSNESQSIREEALARRMRRRQQNHSYYGTTPAPSIFALRW